MNIITIEYVFLEQTSLTSSYRIVFLRNTGAVQSSITTSYRTFLLQLFSKKHLNSSHFL